VRTPEEYSGGHIDHSISLPLQHLEANNFKICTLEKHRDRRLLQSGARSSRAASVLSALGYTSVKNLGGIMSWPYAVVR
jgi:rhodanese-related sulfurtransferase